MQEEGLYLLGKEKNLILIDLTTGKVKKIFWALIWVLKKEKPTTGVGFRGVFVPGAGLLYILLVTPIVTHISHIICIIQII